jgi:ribosomal protein L15
MKNDQLKLWDIFGKKGFTEHLKQNAFWAKTNKGYHIRPVYQ